MNASQLCRTSLYDNRRDVNKLLSPHHYRDLHTIIATTTPYPIWYITDRLDSVYRAAFLSWNRFTHSPLRHKKTLHTVHPHLVLGGVPLFPLISLPKPLFLSLMSMWHITQVRLPLIYCQLWLPCSYFETVVMRGGIGPDPTKISLSQQIHSHLLDKLLMLNMPIGSQSLKAFARLSSKCQWNKGIQFRLQARWKV